MYIRTYIDMLNISIEISPPSILMVADQCTAVRTTWEGPCTDLLYDVTLLSSDGVILQGPFTTSDTVYNFTDVEIFDGNFNVNVSINDTARRASVIGAAVVNVSQDG